MAAGDLFFRRLRMAGLSRPAVEALSARFAAVEALSARLDAVEAELAGGSGGQAGDDHWTPLTLGEGWANQGGPFAVAAFRKDASGLVRLKGDLNANGSASSPLASLPEGYIPSEVFRFWDGTSGASINVATDGGVYHTDPGAIVANLNAISFFV